MNSVIISILQKSTRGKYSFDQEETWKICEKKTAGDYMRETESVVIHIRFQQMWDEDRR